MRKGIKNGKRLVNQHSHGTKLVQTIWTLPKQRRTAFIAASLMFVFTLFFLMPLDLYLNNHIEFNIGFIDIAFPLLVASICIFIALILLFPLILRCQALDVAVLLLCGATAAFYFQVLFLNGEMRPFMDDDTDYIILNAKGWINFTVFYIITFLPLFMWKGLKDSKKYKTIKWEKGVIYASIIILGMQTAGIAASITGYDMTHFDGSQYFSYKKAFQLSSEGNICVFITDRLDVKYMDKALEDYPELNEQLEGFTFYKNNVSTHTFTFPSITRMLTGEPYDNSDFFAYMDKAWARRNIIDVLRENGYRSALLISRSGAYGRLSHVYDRADNITVPEKSGIDKKHSQIAKTTINISFSKAMPYFAKGIFIERTGMGFGNAFLEWPDDVLLPIISVETDLNFYKHLKTAGLSIQTEHKTLSIAHLNCAHDGGYRYNQVVDTIELYDGDRHDSARGCFAILNEYFSQMKDLGIYDNSTIIIVADHGTQNNIQETPQLAGEITSALLIKPINASGDLKTDTESELSNVNFAAGILRIAGLQHEDFGLAYFDIIDGQLPQTREFFLTRDKYKTRDRYIISGDANDFSNWTFISNGENNHENRSGNGK